MPSRSYILAVGGSFLLPFCALVALIVPVVLGGNSLVAAEPSTRAVDWTAWDSLPVFYNGRVMPLVSFARQTVEIICGRTSPTLHPPKNLPPDAQKLFPDGKPRRFTASELVLSWMLYPQAWERIAFLGAGHEQLRTEILGLPSRDAQGAHLRWVSPADVASSEKLRELLEQIRERSEQAALEGQRHHDAVFDAGDAVDEIRQHLGAARRAPALAQPASEPGRARPQRSGRQHPQ